MKKDKNFIVDFILKNPWISGLIAVVVVGGGAFAFVRNGSNQDGQTFVVSPTEFIQVVSISGKVVPAETVDLAFETAGKIAGVNVSVGDKVSQGSTLAFLSNGQLKASLEEEQARLAQIEQGSRPEDVAVTQSSVDAASSSLVDAKQILISAIKDAYAKSDDAVENKTDQYYNNPKSVLPEIFAFDNYPLRLSLNDQRLKIGKLLSDWNTALATLTPETYTPTVLAQTQNNLAIISSFLNDATVAVSTFKADTALTQSSIDKYRADTSTARANVSTATAALNSASQSYTAASSSLDTAQSQLTLKKAGATTADIDIQSAAVDRAAAALAQSIITAPFAGTITRVDAKTGEIASPNTPVIGLISSSQYEIESYIPEADIAKVKVGQSASITLDAYGPNVIFNAKVTAVDPAETIKDGVSTYKTTFQFLASDNRIRSGMTASISIQVDDRTGILVVPQSALFIKNDQKMVTVKNGKNTENRVIVTGALDAKGNAEVISGLSAGETILLNPKN
ncbi:MAG: efflux RND transporter periplasmic adaptor subunit [Candidatus Pacebacteria bacterium]|nr:efflux RND transporter periplasmic adaptor subunit [Candidatus Paceibacterota bacterium]